MNIEKCVTLIIIEKIYIFYDYFVLQIGAVVKENFSFQTWILMFFVFLNISLIIALLKT